MATDKPRYSVTLDEDVLEGVNRFKTENRITTQSKAIIRLVKIALEDLQQSGIISTPLSCPDEGESKLIGMYRDMNEEGKHKLLDCADDMIQSGKYKKAGSFWMGSKEA